MQKALESVRVVGHCAQDVGIPSAVLAYSKQQLPRLRVSIRIIGVNEVYTTHVHTLDSSCSHHHSNSSRSLHLEASPAIELRHVDLRHGAYSLCVRSGGARELKFRPCVRRLGDSWPSRGAEPPGLNKESVPPPVAVAGPKRSRRGSALAPFRSDPKAFPRPGPWERYPAASGDRPPESAAATSPTGQGCWSRYSVRSVTPSAIKPSAAS